MKITWILGLALVPIAAASEIQVVSATYGLNCGATRDNAKAAVAGACDGKRRCEYIVDFHVLGDPVPGCAKTFMVEWVCAGGGAHQQRDLPAEAGQGSRLVLSCGVPGQAGTVDEAAQAAAARAAAAAQVDAAARAAAAAQAAAAAKIAGTVSHQVSLEAQVNTPLPILSNVPINVGWKLTNTTILQTAGMIQVELDNRLASPQGLPRIDLAPGAEMANQFSLLPQVVGKHSVTIQYLRDTGETIRVPEGPNGISEQIKWEIAGAATAEFVVSEPVIPCNGDARLCDRAYDQISYPTTHNSFVNEDESWTDPAQQHGIRRQLDDGIRALMLDAHEKDGLAYLCHVECAWGSDRVGQSVPTLASGLVQVREFLVANPNDVLTIFVETYVTPDLLQDSFRQAGLLSLLYTFGMGPSPAPGMPIEPHWPTLRQMIALDRRLVVLVDSPAGEAIYPWQHYEFRYDGQTSYTYINSTGNIATDCAIDRGITTGIFTMNHMLQAPHGPGYGAINAFDFMNSRAELCRQVRGHIVNFIVVNHYESSAVLNVVLKQNGLL